MVIAWSSPSLYDNSISHLILLSHKYHHGGKTFLGFDGNFPGPFRGIHEKGYDPLTRILNRQAFDVTVNKLTMSFSRSLKSSWTVLRILRSFVSLILTDSNRSMTTTGMLGDETLVLFAPDHSNCLQATGSVFPLRWGRVCAVPSRSGLFTGSWNSRALSSRVETRRFPKLGQVTAASVCQNET